MTTRTSRALIHSARDAEKRIHAGAKRVSDMWQPLAAPLRFSSVMFEATDMGVERMSQHEGELFAVVAAAWDGDLQRIEERWRQRACGGSCARSGRQTQRRWNRCCSARLERRRGRV